MGYFSEKQVIQTCENKKKSLIEIKKRSKLKESHEKRIILRPILKKCKYMVNNSINQLPGATQKAGL